MHKRTYKELKKFFDAKPAFEGPDSKFSDLKSKVEKLIEERYEKKFEDFKKRMEKKKS